MRQSTTPRRSIHRKHLAFAIGNTNSANTTSNALPLLQVIAGESITEGNAVVVRNTADGLRCYNAGNTADDYYYAGIAYQSATTGSVCAIVQPCAEYSSLRYEFTPGEIVYIANGALNLTQMLLPHQHTYQIGIAINETTLLITDGVRVINNTGV